MGNAEERLKELGIILPRQNRRGAGVCAARRAGKLLFVSGQGPRNPDGSLAFVGKLGQELTIQQGYSAARLCALNILAVVKDEIGNLDRIAKVVKVFGLVASASDFYSHPAVMHGFSDTMTDILGKRGVHARSAMGTCCLPENIPVEVEAVFEITD